MLVLFDSSSISAVVRVVGPGASSNDPLFIVPGTLLLNLATCLCNNIDIQICIKNIIFFSYDKDYTLAIYTKKKRMHSNFTDH